MIIVITINIHARIYLDVSRIVRINIKKYFIASPFFDNFYAPSLGINNFLKTNGINKYIFYVEYNKLNRSTVIGNINLIQNGKGKFYKKISVSFFLCSFIINNKMYIRCARVV